MSRIMALGKRASLFAFTTLSLLNFSALGTFVGKWGHYWSANSGKIVMLTFVNTGITTGTEFVSRSILSKGVHKQNHFKFITSNEGPWYRHINQQSLINIWMTFFASLLGAPVYFFRKRWNRFAFFVGFGTFNSFLSQGLLSMSGITTAYIISYQRLLFDFLYNGSIKFCMFEFFRKPIAAHCSIFKLTYLRGKQDLITSFMKNIILNILGFRG